MIMAMVVKLDFTELKYGSGQSRYKQNAIGYFKKGAGLLDMSCRLPVSVEITLPHRITLHVSKHFRGPLRLTMCTNKINIVNFDFMQTLRLIECSFKILWSLYMFKTLFIHRICTKNI